jgi:hypothetical protein
LRPTPTLQWFNSSLHKLCVRFPSPKQTTIDDALVYRFEEQSIFTAILLKTAGYVSGLHAGKLLLTHGFLQELGALQRSMDDFAQDCIFLALACILGETTEDHRIFLMSFWEEEPDFQTYVRHQKNKHEVPRKNIHRYISRSANNGMPDHTEIANAKYLSRIYSGYVHGAAPHLMDLYNPDRYRFEVDGNSSSHLLREHRHDFENYLFRGVKLFGMVANALGDDELKKEALSLDEQLLPHYTK